MKRKKINSKKVILFTLLCLFARSMSAQNVSVRGTVTDGTGESLIGVTIQVQGSSAGSVTDLDGHFVLLNVPSNATIEVSYVGMLTQIIPLNGRTTINVVMEEDTETLEELVVIGYGSIKKSSLTSAVSSMDSKGIENRPLARAETALQGQLAGVTVRTVTGEPGADLQIRVRGAASVNANSDPLYVVDGVPMNSLTWLNPADIATIEVLKDAASSAIYGSRGSNGVVIVSTKKGKQGKATVSANVTYGIQSLEKKLDIMDSREWITFNIKAIDERYLVGARKRGITNASIGDDTNTRLNNMGLSTTAWGNSHYTYVQDPRWFKYVDSQIAAGHNISVQGIDPNEALSLLNWQDEFFTNAPVQDITLNISGGNESTSYLFSGGVYDQNGIASGTDYKRYTARTNIESKLNKYLTLGMSLAPTYITRDGAGRANGKDTRAHHVLSSPPVSEASVGYKTNVEPNTQYLWGGSASSPIVYMENIRHDDIFQMTGNAYLAFTPIEGLKFELTGAADYYDLDGQTYTFSRTQSSWSQGEGVNSSGGHNTQRTWNTLLQAVANYNKTFGLHSLGLMAGTSKEERNIGYSTNQTFNKPFPNDAITGSFDGSQLAVGTDIVTQFTSNRLVSVFGRAQYDYDSKYLLSGSLRYDGGSVFGANNKWGLFPSISVGWNMTKETFFQELNLGWINLLKLRASYGATGNNSISNTAAYPTLSAVNYAGLAGYNANSLGNPDLGWEKTHSTDLAIDLGLLNNRIQMSVDWYTKNTTDLLYMVPTLGASGFSTIWDNLGDIQNQGLEVELNTTNLVGEFNWTTSFNMSYNENKVLSLGVDDTPIYSGFDGSNHSNILKVGEPANSFYLYEAIGVWKTQQEINDYAAERGVSKVTFEGKTIVPGDLRYKDVNQDGVFDKENDRAILGSPIPKMTYGMTNQFSYKNFDLSILLTAQTGGKIFGVLGRAIDRPGMNPNSNMMDVWNNAWWSEEDQGDGRTPYILSSTTGGTVDSRWLWSSDYLRIKNLTLGYKLPINPKYISFARLYCSVENLWKWDNYYNGYSPEAANTASSSVPGGQSALGLDYGSYPLSRIVTFGININF
ncbi:SusC/RagA family TonB-linked outer membrane protein [Proteiniphilum sp. UBA1028]|jgi:TonB-linked SusC/RagA family outer membrane protein|uniref:SusC/RagA family TonB-linked outer membrane protein n=1 Tax=Proteiniphilum sp. UBA1028 TaxID=1947251 RepID=UPI0025D0CDB5|nr:TonB-dependent receptor [Proteiniphilum sp. UBA1028]